MKSTSQILVVLVVATLIGSVIPSIPTKTHAQEIIVQFEKLSEQFQQDVSDLVSTSPPDPDKQRQLALLFDNYEQETFRLLELEPPVDAQPPDPDRASPGETSPPEGDASPPEGDLSR
jgi:hypothetical protein